MPTTPTPARDLYLRTHQGILADQFLQEVSELAEIHPGNDVLHVLTGARRLRIGNRWRFKDSKAFRAALEPKWGTFVSGGRDS